MLRFYLILFTVAVSVVFSVNKWFEKPWKTAEVEIVNPQYQPLYKSVQVSDTISFQYHYQNIEAHFKKPFFQHTVTSFLYRDDEAVKAYYTFYRTDNNPAFSDIGYFGYACIYLYEGFPELAMENLVQVVDKNQPGYHLVKGKILENVGMYQEADEAFREEIAKAKNRSQAIQHLSAVYWAEKNFSRLDSISKSEKLSLPASIAAPLYFKTGKFIEYLKLRLPPQFDIIGLISAFFIVLVWFFYIIRLNLFKNHNWPVYLITFTLSVLCAPIVLILYDYYDLFLDFQLNGEIINDFLYSIFAIGLIEESVKFIPVIFLLLVSPASFKEPFDYILIACISALGFAFSENLLYLDEQHSEIVRGRALMATVSHMFDSSLVAYGLILAKYRYKVRPYAFFYTFLFLASLSHGFYDFWLINKQVSSFILITPLFMIACLLIWITLINNALNQSPLFNYKKHPDTNSIRKYLLSATTFIILFQYALLGFLQGAEKANLEISLSLMSICFFTFFYSSNFSYIDIVKGYWGPVSFRRFAWKVWYNKVIGQTVKIVAMQGVSKQLGLFPIEGIIEGRQVVEKETGFYLLKLCNDIKVGDQDYQQLIVKPLSSDEINAEDETEVLLLLPASGNAGISSKKDMKIFTRAYIQVKV